MLLAGLKRLLVGGALAALLVTACVQRPPPPTVTVAPTGTPLAFLDRVEAAVTAAASYRFEAELRQAGDDPATPEKEVPHLLQLGEGAWAAPDRYRGSGYAADARDVIEEEVRIGTVYCRRSGAAARWSCREDQAPAPTFWAGFHSADSLALLPEGVLDGTPVMRLRATRIVPAVDAQPNAAPALVQVHTLFIAKETYLPLQLETHQSRLERSQGPAAADVPYTDYAVTRFFDFGKPVTIEAPASTPTPAR